MVTNISQRSHRHHYNSNKDMERVQPNKSSLQVLCLCKRVRVCACASTQDHSCTLIIFKWFLACQSSLTERRYAACANWELFCQVSDGYRYTSLSFHAREKKPSAKEFHRQPPSALLPLLFFLLGFFAADSGVRPASSPREVVLQFNQEF